MPARSAIRIETTLKQVEALRQPVEQLLGREEHGARRRELERQREIVKALAERAKSLRGWEEDIEGGSSGAEQGNRVLPPQRRHAKHMLPLQPEPLATGHQKRRPLNIPQQCHALGDLGQ